MIQPTEGRFDAAVFDSPDSGFDVPAIETEVVSQSFVGQLKRAAGSNLIRQE